MRIFSNFDTKLKNRTLRRYQEEFGADSVALITKGGLFWFMNVFLPLSLYILFISAFSILFYISTSEEIFFKIGLPIAIGLLFISILAVINKYIAYKMDFFVVTPKFLIRYNQNGIFKRDIMTLNAFNIKTITVVKQGLLYSIFNTGDLVFLSESDVIHGEVILHYIHKPEKMRHTISQIIKKFD